MKSEGNVPLTSMHGLIAHQQLKPCLKLRRKLNQGALEAFLKEQKNISIT